jgi:hypothetical protein
MDDTTPDPTTSVSVSDMTEDQKRRDQMLRAPGAVEEDAAQRIEVTKHDVTRVDIAPDAAVRPGLADDADDEEGKASE